ncbi:MAG: ABC transporter substrate-binding protein [Pseudomonadales bacterium]|nr:ABC transporter substrate-binding protein [Pseudomonadales bacterium]
MLQSPALALVAFLAVLAFNTPASASPDPADWDAVLTEARGQRVYWHAWGGDARVNDFIAWVGRETRARYGVDLRQVKVSDTAEAVSQVLGEKGAGRDTGGAVDLIWINGENFATLKQNKLLFGPWAQQLPNWRYVDVGGKPTVLEDFTLATEGYEAPWIMAQLVFYHDSRRLPEPPLSMPALLAWARAHPGRFAYPQPPDFLGTTFLKQALYGLLEDPSVLLKPVSQDAFDTLSRPLWDFLEQLTPLLWRSGQAYPNNGARLRQLMADGEIDLALSFNPGEVSTSIATFELPDSVRTYVLSGGTIGNSSFVAIPYNANAIAGSMVVANFLLSAEAQARQQNPRIWGSPSVLAIDRLPAAERRWFDQLPSAAASLSAEQLGVPLPEPHPQWTERLEQHWQQSYGVSR